MTASTPAEPRRLGEFLLFEELGRGAHGVVYRARQDDQPGEIALKLLRQLSDPRRTERFRREARLAASLDHPGIVKVRGSGVEAGKLYIAYELVPGARTLQEALPGTDRDTALRWIREAASALGHAHAQGIVHRDVKPANILIDETGRALITDLGVATARELQPLTQSSEMIGSPSYMTPEQVTADRERIGPHSDVWALGVILYDALTGQLPFEGSTIVELAGQIMQARPTPPRALAPDVPRGLEAVVLRALALHPEDRPPDGHALAAAISAGEARAAASSRRRPALLLAVAVLLAMFVGVLLGRGFRGPRARPANPPPLPDEPVAPVPVETESVDPPAPNPQLGAETARLMQRLVGLPAGSGEALRVADDIVAADPDSGEAHFVRACVLLARAQASGGSEASRQLLGRTLSELEAASTVPRPFADPRLFRSRADLYFALKRYEEAVADYASLHRSDPTAKVSGNYGIALRMTHRLTEAAEVLEEVVARSETPPWQLPYNLAGVYMSQRKLEQAIAAYRQTHALIQGGQNAGQLSHFPLLMVAVSQRSLGRLDEAGETLAQVERILSGRKDPALDMERLNIAFQRDEEFHTDHLALNFLRDYPGDKRTPQVIALRARMMVRTSRQAEALALLEEGLSRYPENEVLLDAQREVRSAPR